MTFSIRHFFSVSYLLTYIMEDKVEITTYVINDQRFNLKLFLFWPGLPIFVVITLCLLSQMPLPGCNLSPISLSLAVFLTQAYILYTQNAPCVHGSRWKQQPLQMGKPWVILCMKQLEQAVPALKQERRNNSASTNNIYFHEFEVITWFINS